MSRVLIIGAKSDIAMSIAKEYAKHGYSLILAGRNIGELKDFASDLNIRYCVEVELRDLDIVDFASHQAFWDAIAEKPEGVIVSVGYMTVQKECESDFDKTLNTINVNFTGCVSLLNIVANDFEARKNGYIVGISSVAGDRGRKANYIYGASKAGFSAYLSGLRNRLHESGVQVLTVKPGFVRTKMTAHLDLPAKLTVKPEEVAKDIFEAQQKGKDVLYTKSIWRWIMMIIKLIPEWKFKGMEI